MGHDTLIEELDFILTHPMCGTRNLESFYNNCLFSYETVPLIVIVNHIQFKRPDLLTQWSKENDLIHKVTNELDFNLPSDTKTKSVITVETDLRAKEPNSNGYYFIEWNSSMEYEQIDLCFKTKKIMVTCKTYGELLLVGLVKTGENKYGLYLKLKGESKYE
ncbi:hypothetical protein C0Q44_28530 [Paenibacillus sp. PCH8]|uniref:hypothetical protein n=1 Tax=Paenibacillus sp. 11B TaxID=3060965 RepID=UPI000CFA548D|nr:hypothetical protein [Paenibacillus sp. 11B]PQP80360.1 hypothetical protein C0Q44_28530 [Paenibacillus sp. PCH8]